MYPVTLQYSLFVCQEKESKCEQAETRVVLLARVCPSVHTSHQPLCIAYKTLMMMTHQPPTMILIVLYRYSEEALCWGKREGATRDLEQHPLHPGCEAAR